MSRRRPKPELQFGSDSFLDVVANIVGILIILIVIAGLRVSRTPIVKMLTPKQGAAEVQSSPLPPSSLPPLAEAIDGTPESSHVVVLEPATDPEEPVPSPEPPPPLPPLEVPAELVELAKKLEIEIATLESAEHDFEERMKLTAEEEAQLREKQRAIRLKLEDKAIEIAASQQKAAVIAGDLELARQTLARLSAQVDELESVPDHIETLEHKITPISRVVNGKEKHYRLEFNRIAEVPIDELVESFRSQIDRRKDWLIKMRQHEGTIGPIKGFNLHYLVRVDSGSEMDPYRAGMGGYRISLASWEVHPEPDLKGETEEVALRRGSQFYQSILGATPDTTLTFWVYPDSYQLFRRLKKFTHQHGFSVAGRPLPKGVPIAGSPHGSKSASQ